MARGRRRDSKKAELWRQRLRAQAGSGLSVRAWCRQTATREAAFYWWRARLNRRDAAAAPSFAPVRVVADTPPSGAGAGGPGRIEIVLPGERRVHVIGRVERQMLAEVLAVLGEAPRGESQTAQPRPHDRWRTETARPGRQPVAREASGC